nr:hypothetical protein [Elizabethkingia bruuniana]
MKKLLLCALSTVLLSAFVNAETLSKNKFKKRIPINYAVLL